VRNQELLPNPEQPIASDSRSLQQSLLNAYDHRLCKYIAAPLPGGDAQSQRQCQVPLAVHGSQTVQKAHLPEQDQLM